MKKGGKELGMLGMKVSVGSEKGMARGEGLLDLIGRGYSHNEAMEELKLSGNPYELVMSALKVEEVRNKAKAMRAAGRAWDNMEEGMGSEDPRVRLGSSKIVLENSRSVKVEEVRTERAASVEEIVAKVSDYWEAVKHDMQKLEDVLVVNWGTSYADNAINLWKFDKDKKKEVKDG